MFKQSLAILSKVVTGRYIVGNSDMKTPPPGYHSTVNSILPSTIFVVYDDAAAYPEYVIKFTV